MAEEKAISIREYARQKGVSDTAVHKAIAAGKIVNGVVGKGTRSQGILASVADVEWAMNTNPNHKRYNKFGKPAVTADVPTGNATAPEVGAKGVKSLAQVKLLQAEVKLQKEALILKKLKGELVDKKQVYAALFAAGSSLKNSVMTVPDRYIDTLLAAPTRNDAHSVLTQALIDALRTASESELSTILETT